MAPGMFTKLSFGSSVATCMLACSEISLPITVEPRLSGHRLSGLFDYPDFFSGPVFFMNINDLRC